MGQVGSGRICTPCEFPPNGDIPTFAPWATDAAFRFGVSQGEKLRARDDLRRNMVSLRTSVMTPIALPTWGRIY